MWQNLPQGECDRRLLLISERLKRLGYASNAPLLIILSLAVALMSYIVGREPAVYVLSIIALSLAITGAFLEYVLLLTLRATRDILDSGDVGIKTLALPALAIGTYIIGIGAIIARNIVRDSLEYLEEKPAEEAGCRPPGSATLVLGLGAPLAIFQRCVLSRISERIPNSCASSSGEHAPVDLGAMSDYGE